ncbi:hypothetical protein PVAND_017070 [Polypedilum vanderplanki]|uniref:Secreted protein n=1 Tax=Polypedilum vanderplanki TaxID=319348 RepID=A0A9J6BHN5_POLVA|nr:hypothetical protein PVAND_017070 [Polypedilum vanderplanki]
MKFSIFIIVFITTFYNLKAFEQPQQFVLLDPGFLTRSSWAYQIKYHELQDNIDAASVSIFEVLSYSFGDVTHSAIQNYSIFAENVLTEYNPVFERVSNLSSSECKNTVTAIIQLAVQQSGVQSSNCIFNFVKKAQGEADAAANVTKEFTGKYGQVVLNVYKSYIGKNAMTDSEIIEQHINSTYDEILSNFDDIQPFVRDLVYQFNNRLQSHGTTLKNCFQSAFKYAEAMLTINNDQVEQCIEADRNLRGKARAGGFRNFTSEALELTQNWPEFKW